jgi:hypothetical protein
MYSSYLLPPTYPPTYFSVDDPGRRTSRRAGRASSQVLVQSSGSSLKAATMADFRVCGPTECAERRGRRIVGSLSSAAAWWLVLAAVDPILRRSDEGCTVLDVRTRAGMLYAATSWPRKVAINLRGLHHPTVGSIQYSTIQCNTVCCHVAFAEAEHAIPAHDDTRIYHLHLHLQEVERDRFHLLVSRRRGGPAIRLCSEANKYFKFLLVLPPTPAVTVTGQLTAHSCTDRQIRSDQISQHLSALLFPPPILILASAAWRRFLQFLSEPGTWSPPAPRPHTTASATTTAPLNTRRESDTLPCNIPRCAPLCRRAAKEFEIGGNMVCMTDSKGISASSRRPIPVATATGEPVIAVLDAVWLPPTDLVVLLVLLKVKGP